MTRFAVALVAGGLCATACFGASPNPQDLAIPPEALSKARELVRKLGSESYREREEAHAELVRMGRLARPALLDAVANDPDPEVRFRASRLLPKAGADDLKARLDTFLADTEGKYKHQLPGWEKFVATTRETWSLFGYPVWTDRSLDKAARELFVEVVKSPYNVELLQALDQTPAEAGRAISDRRVLLYSTHINQRNVGGRFVPPTPAPLADIACLLLAETVVPSKDVPRVGQWSYVTGATFLTQQSSTNALTGNNAVPHADPYRQIVIRWMETRDDIQDLSQLSYIAGQQLRSFPQSLTLLRRIITTEGVPGYSKAQAMMYLVRGREKEEFDFLVRLLKDETMVTTVWFGNVNPAQPQQQQLQCLVKDVALAMLVTHTGQSMPDYGFKFPPGNPIPNVGNIGYGNYAFENDDARRAAMVKFGFWRLKQGLKDANAKEPEGKKDAPPPPPVPRPQK